VKLLHFSGKNLQKQKVSSLSRGYRFRLLCLFHERLRAIADESRSVDVSYKTELYGLVRNY